MTLLAIAQPVLIEALKEEEYLDDAVANFQAMLNQEERRRLARSRFMGAVQKVINATG